MTDKTIYPYLELRCRDKKSTLHLPQKKFPPKFLVEDKKGFCGGYFASYNKAVDKQELFNLCKKNRWDFFGDLEGEFLIFFSDFESEEIHIIVDQNGKFPCYFSLDKEKLIISPDFGLVARELKQRSLNLNYAFDFLNSSHFLYQTDETILREVKQIPVGTVLSISPDFNFNIDTIVDVGGFLKKKVPVFNTVEDFSNKFLVKLEEIVEEKVRILDRLGIKYASDLSTGFDSTLVSYLLKKVSTRSFKCITQESPYIIKDTDPKVARRFAEKHKLDYETLLLTDEFLALSDFDIRWTAEHLYPATHSKLIFTQAKRLSNRGISVWFNGFGGDEIYGSPNIDTEILFHPQIVYFRSFVSHNRDNQLSLVLNSKGLAYFLDHERFRQKNYFPIIHSPSALYVHLIHFPIYWETDVWPITPFVDRRLAEVARGMPVLKNGKLPTKFDVWKNHTEIFVESQFRPGGHMSDLFKRYLIERKPTALEILSNSKLEKTGLFRIRDIRNDISGGVEGKYLQDYGVNTVLMNLLYLEVFLQKNKVKI